MTSGSSVVTCYLWVRAWFRLDSRRCRWEWHHRGEGKIEEDNMASTLGENQPLRAQSALQAGLELWRLWKSLSGKAPCGRAARWLLPASFRDDGTSKLHGCTFDWQHGWPGACWSSLPSVSQCHFSDEMRSACFLGSFFFLCFSVTLFRWGHNLAILDSLSSILVSLSQIKEEGEGRMYFKSHFGRWK